DAGNDGAVGVHQIDRVQAPAQSDFQYRYIQLAFFEQHQSGQRRVFEITQGDLAARAFDLMELIDDVLVARLLAINPDTLIEVDEVGRRVGADLVAGRQQHGLEHGAGGALAIGPAHRDLHERQRQLQLVRHGAYAVQAKIYGSAVQGF